MRHRGATASHTRRLWTKRRVLVARRRPFRGTARGPRASDTATGSDISDEDVRPDAERVVTTIEPTTVLEARHLSRHFTQRSTAGWFGAKRVNRAVDDVSLHLDTGRVTAVVGESGSGKSVLARMLARIVTPTSGDLVLNEEPIPIRSKRTLQYASEVQLVLQDPFASINPVHRIRHSLERPLAIHGTPQGEIETRASAALARVSLEPPERFMDRYPHELSGGQLQRVSIARALCVNPKVLLADEPISMLDVSVRLGVLNLLRGLCDDEQLAVLYICL